MIRMQSSTGNSIKIIPLDRINIPDRYYSITPCPFNEEKLIRSIKEAGIIVPVRLEAGRGDHYRIISGFKRMEASIQLGLAEVPAIVEDKGDPALTFWRAVQENCGSRELHDLEKAEIVLKLKELHSVGDQALLSSCLPGLECKGTRYELDRLIALAEMSTRLKSACIRGNLLSATALEVRKWPDSEQEFMIALISSFKLGTNKQKQLVRLIADLKKIEGAGLDTVWENSGLKSLDPSTLTFDLIHQALTRTRFPVFSAHLKEWQILREGLKLPSGIKIEAPRYFDGDSITATFSAADPEEFRDKAAQLMEASRKKELDDMFSLL